MPSAHAKLGPSSSKRWMLCGGSVEASQNVLSSAGAAADDGTAGHHIFETWLGTGRMPQTWVGHVIPVGDSSVLVTQDLADWVDEAIEWTEAYIRSAGQCLVQSEHEVDIGPVFGLPLTDDGKTNLWGTTDLVIATARELVIGDLKLGFHEVDVGWFDEAADVLHPNTQLALYAVGVEHELRALAFDWVRFVILQPRAGGAKELRVPIRYLHEWRERVHPRVIAATRPDAPRVPSGEACQWCPAAPTCSALHEQAVTVAQQEFAAIDAMGADQIGWLLSKEKMVRGLLSAVKRHALKLARLGQKIPGFKLVEGKRNREWTNKQDAARAIEALGFNAYEVPDLISPAQAEKLIGKGARKVLAPYIHKPQGTATIAPESDRRPELEPDFVAVEDPAIEDAEVVEEID